MEHASESHFYIALLFENNHLALLCVQLIQLFTLPHIYLRFRNMLNCFTLPQLRYFYLFQLVV